MIGLVEAAVEAGYALGDFATARAGNGKTMADGLFRNAP
jgi:hypothetical protein